MFFVSILKDDLPIIPLFSQYLYLTVFIIAFALFKQSRPMGEGDGFCPRISGFRTPILTTALCEILQSDYKYFQED